MKLFYVSASPRGALSASKTAAAHYLAMLGARRPALDIDALDLWSTVLPEFNGAAISAKYAKLSGRALTDAEADAWRVIGDMVDRLKAADSVLIATPMWNFGIPYKLKHWIDLITQPGLTFSFDPAHGYTPLISPKPALVIVSSGRLRRRPKLRPPRSGDTLFAGGVEIYRLAGRPVRADRADHRPGG
jgi:FMN-dependent NADH-azoreductase